MPILHPISRRGFLAGAASAAVVAACSSSSKKSSSGGAAASLPDPASAPFDTIVVLTMENRSYDHLLGWLPGTNGKQAGLSYPGPDGNAVSTYDLATNVQGCDFMDPAHDWQSVAKQYNGGKCDGWLQTQTTGDHFPVGYYTEAQVPILGALARNYTVFDNYFCSLMAATWPNRMYQLCATTDLDQTGLFPAPDAARPSQVQLTIFDRLQAAGLTGAYYTWGEPMTGLFESRKYDGITFPKDKFFTDADAGTLPNVSFLDPDYTTISELRGTSNDDHPHGSISAGEGYIADVYRALIASPQWERLLFFVTFDEHGGFYDHVAPPTVADDNVNPNPGPHPDYSRLGFRVPGIAVGPFAPKKVVTAGPYEHCSMLRTIEWRWNLQPMTKRDANAKNLADTLDFNLHREAADLPPFTAPPATPCPGR